MSKIGRQEYYNSHLYKQMRKAQLTMHPLCKLCEEKGIVTAAQEVDHIIPRHKGGALLDYDNLQSLCVDCHKAKTAAENRTADRRGGACIHGTPSHLHCAECD